MKNLKQIVEEAVKELIMDGKIEIQDENGEKIEDLSVGIQEDADDIEDEYNYDDEEDDSDEETDH